jgi:hypothetical protein
MGKGWQHKAKVIACGLGMSTVMAVPMVGLVSGTAGADGSGCYTGCTSPSSGVTSSSASGGPTTASSSSSDGLAFTGADLGEMAIIGVGAVAAGAVLVRRSRRRTPAEA